MNLTDNGGATVSVEGMSSTGATAANLSLYLMDANEKQMLKIKLDENAEAKFKIPDQPYTVLIDGGPGHTVREDGPMHSEKNNTLKRTHYMLKKFKAICSILALTGLCAGSVSAHSLWVNINESFAHPPGHVITSLGWGHAMPLDDFLVSEAGIVEIEVYSLVGPDNSISPIPLPVIKQEKETESKTGITIVPGDLGLRKISLTDKTMPGTYQVAAESKATYFTGYVDANGNHRMATKPMDDIKGAKSFNFSTRYKAMAKSYFSTQKWTRPNPLGHDLEIMPETNMTNIKVGDLVKFTVTLKGTPLTCDMKGMNYLHMTSNTFGGPDKYMLSAYIMNGKAQIRVPTPGAWRASVSVEKMVTEDNEFKQLAKKCRSINYAASVSFTAKP